MSNQNPTPLQLGMTGALNGKTYRIVGRVVMGVTDDGATYYWNEFNLEADDGTGATLVYEETEAGPQWRLFTMFEPQFAMTAADAATKRIGAPIDFGDGRVQVTLVDRSRVYYIEGKAPEGVEVGDSANYFNAESGNKMIVVSWTGDEVEYYRGYNIGRGTVSTAFNLPRASFNRFPPAGTLSGAYLSGSDAGSGTAYNGGARFLIVAALMLGLLAFFAFISCQSTRRPAPFTRIKAPASPLMLGGNTTLDGKTYRIVSHAVVDMEQVGLQREQHEFAIQGSEGENALLVYADRNGKREWCLYTPLEPLVPMTREDAATQHVGDIVNIDGWVAPVKEIFQSKLKQLEGDGSGGWKSGDLQFGFTAATNSIQLLVRWDASGIRFQRGKILADGDVIK